MKRTRWLLIPALSWLAACAWWMAGRPGMGAVDRIIFSHALHEEQGTECGACHGEVASSTAASQSFAPGHPACFECHEEDNCALCHTNVEARRPRLEPQERIAFAHARHLELQGVTCQTCHLGVTSDTVLPVELPGHPVCFDCHQHQEQYAAGNCRGCHPSMQQLPLEAVAEFNHAGNWIDRHMDLARVQSASCLQCHPQTTCAECHSRLAPATRWELYPEQVAGMQIHRADWRSVHAIEARADGAMCQRCHGTPFCQRCHTVQGVTDRVTNARFPHPPGYALPGGPAFHGDDARLHITTCAACHDQGAASNCVSCHRVGGIGGNPHPAGWTDAHDRDDIRGNSMCRICHTSAL